MRYNKFFITINKSITQMFSLLHTAFSAVLLHSYRFLQHNNAASGNLSVTSINVIELLPKTSFN